MRLLIALFLSFNASAQSIPALSSAFVSGAARGFGTTIQHHFYAVRKVHPGIDETYWNPDTSWVRKYKNFPHDTRAAYFGSKTFLVWTTDAWHLTNTVQKVTLLAVVPLSYKEGKTHRRLIKEFVILSIVESIGFNIVYNGIY